MKMFSILTLLFFVFQLNTYAQEQDASPPASSTETNTTNTQVQAENPTQPVESPSVPNSNNNFFRHFGLNLIAGARYSSWTPGFKKDYLDFGSESSAAYSFKALINLMNFPLIHFNYERPFNSGSNQQSLLEKNKTQKKGIEQLEFAVHIGHVLVPLLDIKNPLVKFLLSLRFQSSKETFFGDVKAKQTFAYVGKDSVVTKVSSTVYNFSGLKRIYTDEVVAFHTEFKNQSATMAVSFFEEQFPMEFRFGFYSVEYVRPSDEDRTWRTTADNLRIFYDTTFKSKGMELNIGNYELDRPGPGFYLKLRYGLDNDIESVVSNDYKSYTGKDLVYGQGQFDFWYNVYFNKKNEKDGLNMSFWMSFGRKYFANYFDPFSGGVENDNISKFFVNVGYYF